MPAPAFVQKKSSVGTNPVPLAVVFTSNNTAGNLLIACAEFFGADAPYSISDTAGNTWIPIFTSSGVHSAGGWDLVAWYAMNCIGGANTVTFDSSTHNSSSTRATVVEFSGIALTAALDGAGNHGDGSGTSLSSGSFATTVGDLIIGYGFAVGGSAAIGAGFTNADTGGDVDIICEYKIGAATSDTATGTCASGSWTMLGFAFLPPASSSPDTLVQTPAVTVRYPDVMIYT